MVNFRLSATISIVVIAFIIQIPNVAAAVESPFFKTPIYLLFIPIGFRATCYYFRGWYGKRIFGNPTGCAITASSGSYTKEWWIHKTHRLFLVAAIALLILHVYDAVANVIVSNSFFISNLLEWLDVIFLSLYVLSCHSIRYFIGSKIACFSCSIGGQTRFRAFQQQSRLNQYHGVFFWISLVTIFVLEIYVRLLEFGIITDFRVF